MKEFIGDDTSQLLNLLVDGEIEEVHETTLFTALAEDGELRNELKELLAIREAVRNDVEAFTPPVNASKSIFSAIGFDTPIGNSPAAIPASNGSFLSNAFKRSWAPVVAALLGSLFTGLIVSNIYENKLADLKSSAPIVSSFESKSEAQPSAKIATKSDVKNDNAVVVRKRTHNHIAKAQDFVAQPQVANNDIAQAENVAQAVEPEMQIQNITKSGYINSPFNSLTNNLNNNIFNEKPVTFTPFIPVVSSGDKGYTVFVSGMIAAAPTNIMGYSVGGFINSGLKNLKLGIILGTEPFSLNYMTQTNNIKSEIPNNPDLFYAGFSLRYEATQLSLINNLSPYGQFFIGGTGQGGPLIKGIAGLQYTLGSIGINCGLDANFLNYTKQGKQYITNKIGFTGGFFYNF
jgi:hypothetical protein